MVSTSHVYLSVLENVLVYKQYILYNYLVLVLAIWHTFET